MRTIFATAAVVIALSIAQPTQADELDVFKACVAEAGAIVAGAGGNKVDARKLIKMGCKHPRAALVRALGRRGFSDARANEAIDDAIEIFLRTAF